MTPQLRAIAGLIQKLSYRDMQDLAAKLNARMSGTTTDSDVAASLLLVCDQLLSPKVSEKDQGGVPHERMDFGGASSSSDRQTYRR